MKRHIPLIALAVGLAMSAACASSPSEQTPADPRHYSGVLHLWFEGQNFRANGEETPWAVGITPEAHAQMATLLPEGFIADPMANAFDVEVEGTLAPANPEASRYGPIGNYAHYLTITRMISLEVEPVSCPQRTFQVYFDTNSASLSDAAIAVIDDNANETRRRVCNIQRVTVVGVTDTRGSAIYNQALSERRAEAVRDAMTARGYPAQVFQLEGRGEAFPLRATGDNMAEPLNRAALISVE